jgi:hypothetical protein
MSRPLMFLDVDGVLNPYGAAAFAGYEAHDLFPGEEPVHVHPAHASLLARLGEVFELVWASSWNDQANTLLAPLLGIAPLPVVPMPAPPFDPDDKVALVSRHAGDRPAAWLDDQHGARAREWATSRRAPTLLLSTDPSVGLTDTLVRTATDWARRCAHVG